MRKIALLFVLSCFPLWANPSGQKARILGDYVNLRGVPTVNGDVVTVMKKNDRVSVIKRRNEMSQADGKSNYWYKIIHERTGKQGWVFGTYLGLEVAPGGKSLNLDRQIGPVGNSEIRMLEVSLDGTIYVVHNNSLSISKDGGAIWQTLEPTVLGQKIGTIDAIHTSGSNGIALGSTEGEGSGFWISHNGGQTWSRFRASNGLPSNEVKDVAILSSARWLALTEEGSVMTEDAGKSWKPLSGYDPGGDALALAVCSGSAGSVSFWVSFEDGVARALRSAPGQLSRLDSSDEIEDSPALACSSDGSVWAGGDDGIHLLNESGYRHFESGSVNDIIAVGTMVLVATDNGISFSTDQGTGWSSFTAEQGLADDEVDALAFDSRSLKLYVAADNKISVLSLR
ncbi:MAG: SH3 domain-containing protein [Leptospiraceae bacterium]